MKFLEKAWLKKNWSNILMVVLILLLIIPQTRSPLMVFVQRTFAFGPSTAGTDEQLTDYQWPLHTLEGDEISFMEAKNEVTVVNFWATWCPPCIAEMPYFQDLYDRYGDEVKFYFVTDENPERVQTFMEKHQYDLPIQIAQYAPPELMQSRALPTTFIFGKDGGVHVKKKGSAKWNSSKVTKLLDNLLAE